MQYLALLTVLGLRCVATTGRDVTVARCMESADIRYTLRAGESRDFRFGADHADMDNLLIGGVGDGTSVVNTNNTNNVLAELRQGHCEARIEVCYDCHIKMTFLNMRLPSCASGKTCRCNYVSIMEVDYEKTRRNLCGVHDNATFTYETKTKGIKLDFIFDDPYNTDFTIRAQSMYNIFIVQGHSNNYRGNRSGHLESPHFPQGYPSYYTAEYQLRNLDPDGYVQVIFTDFLLSPWSYVKLEDSNGSEIHTYRGNIFRPPVIQSTGPNMTIKFKAENELPSPGFRVKYSFHRGHEKFLMKFPKTECGGLVDGFGGSLTVNLGTIDPLQGYDCVWIIRPRTTDETHLSLRVVQFQDMGPKSELSIYHGLTSKSELLETLVAYDRYEAKPGPPTQEFVVSVDAGYYLRFKGYFTNRSRLAIIYTAFKFESCIPNKDFRCNNGRCIKPALHCDGFNHCDDGSDEVSCYDNVGTLAPEDSTWWRTLTPNYYFPKSDGGGAGGGTNTLILITSMAGLGMFVLTTALILVKLHKQRREDNTRHMLRTVSADVDSSPRLSPHQSGEPPLYDPPPSYEDVVKFYLPPPPTYTSLDNGRLSPSSSTSGMDNGGFVPDSGTHSSSPGRHARSASALPQSLLSVILPARVLNRNASAPGTLKQQSEAFSLDLGVQNGSLDYGVQNGSLDYGVRNESTDFRVQSESADLGVQNEHMDLELRRASRPSGVKDESMDFCEPRDLMDLSSPAGSLDLLPPPPPYEVRPRDPDSTCTCQGACCCPGEHGESSLNSGQQQQTSPADPTQ